MATLRHEFYETDDRVTVSIFDKGADSTQVAIAFEPRQLSYVNGDKQLILQPLKGQIDPTKSEFTVGKVKVEVRLAKMASGRWGGLVGNSPDVLANTSASASVAPSTSTASASKRTQKNWEGITTDILTAEKEKTTEEDPNVGGETSLNSFFQKIFSDADEDTKRAMLKSYQESGGTTLSTNWDEVSKGKVEVKPPTGSEWKKWN